MSGDDATAILSGVGRGEHGAADRLLPLVYDELRALAASRLHAERPDHTLQPTALVHEAYLKLIDQTRVQWQGRAHFMAVAAEAIRRILVDHARAHGAAKRGGGWERGPLENVPAAADGRLDVEALDAALRSLAELDPRQAKVVELRFFGGLDVPEVAEVLGVSERTVKGDWRVARAWLKEKLG